MYQTENKTFYDLATDVDFWRHLNPGLTISVNGSKNRRKPFKLQPEVMEELRDSIVEEGYFHLDTILDPKEMKRLANAVKIIKAQMWPPVFGYVYDEFWQVYHQCSGILNELLGPGYRQMPNLWIFYINPDNESHGWAPHRDRSKVFNLFDDGMPQSINLWIPITDATPLNGCMYMLPAHRDLHYDDNPWHQGVDNLQDIRAVPGRTGSVLGWNETVFHWGGRASKRASEPRIALATVFQTTDVGALEIPLFDPLELLPFETRLGLIGQQFNRFTVQGTFTDAETALANELGKFLPENVHILDDGNKYWDITTNTIRPYGNPTEDDIDTRGSAFDSPEPNHSEEGNYLNDLLDEQADGNGRRLSGPSGRARRKGGARKPTDEQRANRLSGWWGSGGRK